MTGGGILWEARFQLNEAMKIAIGGGHSLGVRLAAGVVLATIEHRRRHWRDDDDQQDIVEVKVAYVAGLWPVFNIVFRSLGGPRPPDPPGWGAAAPQTSRGGFGGRQPHQPGGSGGREPPQ